MKRYRVWWSIADNWGADSVVVEADSIKEARAKVRYETIGQVVIPEWLRASDAGSGFASLYAEVDDVEELSD